MNHPIISILLSVLAALSIAAEVLALRRLRRAEPTAGEDRAQRGIVVAVAVGAGTVFAYRYVSSGQWQPLTAHLDGLLLISALLAITIAFIQTRPRLFGLSAFGLPLLTLMLAWGVCSAAWTYRPFNLDTLHPVWMGFHLTCVYLGTLCAAVAAIAGGMFLYVQRRLKQKRDLPGLGKLASLERLELLIIQTASLGFTILTLALITGLILLIDQPGGLPAGWWLDPKIVLATAAWLVYAVVMNVRYATTFRGQRAAWLSIAGFVLLLLAYGIVTSMPGPVVVAYGGPG